MTPRKAATARRALGAGADAEPFAAQLAAMATAESVSVRTSDGFAAQVRRLMLLARRKERLRSREQPLNGIFDG
jgi:hypothetical protein